MNRAIESRWRWLTEAAFVIGVGVVVARVTMLETLRDPFAVGVGSAAVPKGAGAGTGVVLDMLGWVPLILVLLRGVLDGYEWRGAGSFWWVGLLAGWGMCSIGWAADRFAAVVGAFHFASGVALFLGMTQVVRDWARLRMVGAVAFGLLLVFGSQGVYYKWVDLPDLQRSFQQNKESILKERGWDPGSFQAEQFSRKITGGEMIGFSASPNTYAAVIVLVSVIAMGLIVQRMMDGDGPGWGIVYGIGLLIGAWVVWETHGKGAMVAMGLGAAGMAGLWAGAGDWLGRHARKAYWIGLSVVLLGMAGVVGHGLYWGGLPTDSLNFRWRYWVGSERLFLQHPLAGVGWNNFGSYYLGTRVGAAGEEIKDPHNFLLKFFLELGVIGGVLAVGWMLWMWREVAGLRMDFDELSRVADCGLLNEENAGSPIKKVAWIAMVGMVINILASVDLGEQSAFVVVELFKRGLFFCVLVIGMALVALRRMDQAEVDGRKARWVWYAMAMGVGLFLVQSLIDVAFFEVGAMFLFLMVMGSALGIRLKAAENSRARIVCGLVVVGIACMAGLGAIVGPVLKGEGLAGLGDDAMRGRRPGVAVGRYGEAFAAVPWDAEYAFRAGKAAAAAGDVQEAMTWLDRAIAADPMEVEFYLMRGQIEIQTGAGVENVKRDYDKALLLNPNDVGVRVGYGDWLARVGERSKAREEYQIALEKNGELDLAEPKRLTKGEVERIEGLIKELD